ncbi:uncharacterized protein LOC113750389 [Coffea eugenioides]|uniref:uncharacterized protein LOC113750389 n=1 Tax=Coffea eugenioides TaxID=49369 RepID=UPI000F60572D|nr:uncharacterized protein LOC113750389 [Coffea eugenioides]
MVGHGNTVQERLQRQELAFEDLMQRLGDVPEGFNVVDALLQTREMINTLTAQMEETRQTVSSVGDVVALRNEVASSNAEIATLQSEIGVLKRAVGSSNTQTVQKSSRGKVKVPEPKPYQGSRSSKDLENFLWDVEQYFKAVDVPEVEKVSIASMYLSGDAKLWWRTMQSDPTRPKVETWDVLKEELKKQFLPTNVSWKVRDALWNLKQNKSVHEYVAEFQALMLDVKEMSEEDRLYTFIRGLQPWAQRELRRQNVQTVSQALVAAEKLIDFESMGSNNDQEKEKGKDLKGGPFAKKKKKKQSGTTAEPDGASPSKEKQAPNPRKDGCFNCGGPHLARNCPNKKKDQNVSALVAEDDGDLLELQDARINPMQFVNAITGTNGRTTYISLMYVQVTLNGNRILAMMDTGASHSCVTERVVKQFQLKLKDLGFKLKAVNSEAKPVLGVATVELELGPWKGWCSLMASQMDDFDLILGKDFMVANRIYPIPHLDGVMVDDDQNPGFVAAVRLPRQKGNQRKNMVSAVQAESSLRHGEVVHVAALVGTKPDMYQEVPDAVAHELEEFADLMPAELPEWLPPRRAVEHRIELVPGAQPPAQTPYSMTLMELAELRRQLNAMLESQALRPSKALYGAPALSRRKTDGTLRIYVDYRALFDRLARAHLHTRSDLRLGYRQVQMTRVSEDGVAGYLRKVRKQAKLTRASTSSSGGGL